MKARIFFFALFITKCAIASINALDFNAEWMNQQVTPKALHKLLFEITDESADLTILVDKGHVSIYGMASNPSVITNIHSKLEEHPFILKIDTSIHTSELLGASSTNGWWESVKDTEVSRLLKKDIKNTLKEHPDNPFTLAHLSTVDNNVSISGWTSSESLKTTILELIKQGKGVRSISDYISVSANAVTSTSAEKLPHLIKSKASTISNKDDTYALLIYGAVELSTKGLLEASNELLHQALLLDEKRFEALYGLACNAATMLQYEQALSYLKNAVSCENFDLTHEQVYAEFKKHPILQTGIPLDLKTLPLQNVQLLKLRNTLIDNQERFGSKFSFTTTPAPEIAEARMVLSKGNFEASYANYMRYLTRTKGFQDHEVDQMIEALSIWRFAYATRICQLGLSLYDIRKQSTIDRKFLQMVCEPRRPALPQTVSKDSGMIFSQYKSQYARLFTNNAENKDSMNMEHCCIGISFAPAGFGFIEEDYPRFEVSTKSHNNDKQSQHEIWSLYPSFQVLDWKEATIDYTEQKKKFNKCMSILNKVLEREQSSGTLSSDSLTRLYEIKSLMIQYEIYVDKLYRAFLFDAPLLLTLASIDAQLEDAHKGIFNNDQQQIKKIGQRHAKLTPIIQYVALDDTHSAWMQVNTKIKKHLSKKNFEELKTISKTQPNWLRDIGGRSTR